MRIRSLRQADELAAVSPLAPLCKVGLNRAVDSRLDP